MVAFAEVVQVVDRLQKVADVGLPALQSSLPSLEHAGREALRRTIASAAEGVQRIASGAVGETSLALGADVSVDAVVSRFDPTKGLDPKTFSVDGPKGHPWIKEDLANLTHATAEKERVERDRGRGSHQAFLNPVPSGNGIVPWVSTEPPKMRDGASMQSRHPLIKL
jgi:hypothetical protein